MKAIAAQRIVNRDRMIAELFLKHNKLRVSPLLMNHQLNLAAQHHADDMAVRNFFAHDSPEGLDAGDRAGAVGFTGSVGENLHCGRSGVDTIVEGWMRSDGHRQNLVDPNWTQVGFGIALHRTGLYIGSHDIVAVYGRP